MRRFAADVVDVIATHRGRARFAKPAKGLFLGELCRQWAVVCVRKCNVFSRFFNIVSAFLVVEWMSGGKKSILARVVLVQNGALCITSYLHIYVVLNATLCRMAAV